MDFMYKPGDLFMSNKKALYKFLCLYLGDEENKPSKKRYLVIRDNYGDPHWKVVSKENRWFTSHTEKIILKEE